MKDYFDYLYSIGFDDDGDHERLARLLFEIPYEWENDRDENRMWDGVEMRREYEEVCKIDRSYDISRCLNGDACTMLEFFVGFAYRLVRDMFNHDIFDMSYIPKLIKMWFDEDHLDIWRFVNEEMDEDEEGVSEAVVDQLDIWVHCNYEYDGSCGGLFIIRDPEEDIRYTEMWVQASWWYNDFTGE